MSAITVNSAPEMPVARLHLPRMANNTSVRQKAVRAFSGAYSGHCMARKSGVTPSDSSS